MVSQIEFDTSSADINNPDNFTYENDSRQVFHRLAGCWTYWGWKYKYFDTEEDALNFYYELYFMLAGQFAAPNHRNGSTQVCIGLTALKVLRRDIIMLT